MNANATKEIVTQWYDNLSQGKIQEAISSFTDDAEWDIPANKYNQIVSWAGKRIGRDQISEAFRLRDEVITLNAFELRQLVVEGNMAVAFVYECSTCKRTSKTFEIEVLQVHRLRDGKIAEWKAYYDPNPIIDALGSDLDQMLIETVLKNDLLNLKKIIAIGANPNAREKGKVGLTALMIASAQANYEIVSFLLSKGADVFSTDKLTGATALHKACQGGSVEVAKLLLDAGAFVDAVTPTMGHTPIMDALWYKWTDLVKLLIDYGANLNLGTHYGFTMDDHLEFELNVNQGEEKQKFVAIKEMIDQGRAAAQKDIESQNVMVATIQGDAETVKKLTGQGSDVNTTHPHVNSFEDGYTPLLTACRNGHTEIVQALLAAGAKVRVEDWIFKGAPIHKATYNGNLEILNLLVEHPDIDLDVQGPINGYTPLQDALWHGYKECATVLINAGADLTLKGHDGKTALDMAVEVLGEEDDVVALLRSKIK